MLKARFSDLVDIVSRAGIQESAEIRITEERLFICGAGKDFY